MSWLALELYRRGMLKLGKFKLTSGLESPFYIDLRKLYSYPDLARRVAKELASIGEVEKLDGVVGIATAGIALAAYIAALYGIPMAYVRTERKEHGTLSLVEGEVAGKRVAIIDDVATTGGSIERAFRALREAGAEPVVALVVVDREQGAKERLSRLGLELRSLATARQLFEELYRAGTIDEQTLKQIISYIESTRVS